MRDLTAGSTTAEFLEENRDTVTQIALCAFRRLGMPAEEAEEFVADVYVRLLSAERPLVARCTQPGSARSYLSVAIMNLARDYRTKAWGKWRPSAQARRLGALATRLERMLHRDGYSLSEATRLLSAEDARLSEKQLVALSRLLPRRVARRSFSSIDAGLMSPLAAPSIQADQLITHTSTARALVRLIREALVSASDQERTLIHERFVVGKTVATIARERGIKPARAYRILAGCLSRIRQACEGAGIGPAAASAALDAVPEELATVFREIQPSADRSSSRPGWPVPRRSSQNGAPKSGAKSVSRHISSGTFGGRRRPLRVKYRYRVLRGPMKLRDRIAQENCPVGAAIQTTGRSIHTPRPRAGLAVVGIGVIVLAAASCAPVPDGPVVGPPTNDSGIPSGFGFPADEATLLKYRDDQDVAAMRRHAWNVWAGMTQPTPSGDAHWETWSSKKEVWDPEVRSPASVPAPAPPNPRELQRDFVLPRQLQAANLILPPEVDSALFEEMDLDFDVSDRLSFEDAVRERLAGLDLTALGLADFDPADLDLAELDPAELDLTEFNLASALKDLDRRFGTINTFDTKAILSFTLFNEATRKHTQDNRLHLKSALTALNSKFDEEGTPAQLRRIPDYPPESVAVKTAWWPVAAEGFTPLPVWDFDPVPHDAEKNPPSTWRRVLAVQAADEPTATRADVEFNDLPYENVPVVSISRLHHFELETEDQVNAINAGPQGRVVKWVLRRQAEIGDYVALVAFHFTTREIPDWVWATLWWHDQPDGGPYAIGRPERVEGVWRNYLMDVTFSGDTPREYDGAPNAVYNPWLEGFLRKGLSSNCLTCHQRATWPPLPFKVPRGALDSDDPRFEQLFADKAQLDFLFSLQFNALGPPSEEPVR